MKVHWKLLLSLSLLLLWSSDAGQAAGPAKKQAGKTANQAPIMPTPDPISTGEVNWLNDYAEGMRQAELSRKMLMIYFYNPAGSANQYRFERESLAEVEAVEVLRRDYISVRIPLDYQLTSGDETTPLLKYDAFAELHGRAGVA